MQLVDRSTDPVKTRIFVEYSLKRIEKNVRKKLYMDDKWVKRILAELKDWLRAEEIWISEKFNYKVY